MIKLNQTEQDIYDFLVTPRTAVEIMEFMGHKTPPYGSLRLLQRLDLVDKRSAYEKAKALFVQSGRPAKLDKPYVQQTINVMGVQL